MERRRFGAGWGRGAWVRRIGGVSRSVYARRCWRTVRHGQRTRRGEVVAEVISHLCSWRLTAWLWYRVDGVACVSGNPYGGVVSREVLRCSW